MFTWIEQDLLIVCHSRKWLDISNLLQISGDEGEIPLVLEPLLSEMGQNRLYFGLTYVMHLFLATSVVWLEDDEYSVGCDIVD